MPIKKIASSETPLAPSAAYVAVRGGIVEVVSHARVAAARSVNALMTASYWEIGRRIVQAEQKGKRRAGYGEQLIEQLSVDLTAQFGRGFSRQNLQQMRQFYVFWPIRQTLSGEFKNSLITQAPSAQLAKVSKAHAEQTLSPIYELRNIAQAFPLPWSAYVALLSVKSEQARGFYESEALVRKLRSAFLISPSTSSGRTGLNYQAVSNNFKIFQILSEKLLRRAL